MYLQRLCSLPIFSYFLSILLCSGRCWAAAFGQCVCGLQPNTVHVVLVCVVCDCRNIHVATRCQIVSMHHRESYDNVGHSTDVLLIQQFDKLLILSLLLHSSEQSKLTRVKYNLRSDSFCLLWTQWSDVRCVCVCV